MAGSDETTSRAVRRRRRRSAALTALLWVLAVPIAFPLYWMLVSSLKKEGEIFASPPTLWPRHETLENYRSLGGLGVGAWLVNSLVVCAGTVGIVIVLGSVGAYSLSRFNYRGKTVISAAVLYSYLFPTTMMVVPLFAVISGLGLVDTRIALVLANMTIGLPFALWLLRAYFGSLPKNIEEAAHIDGAGYLRGFVDVVVPQLLPGIVSTAVFVAITTWNNYLFALVFLTSSTKYTVPVGISSLQSGLQLQWGPLMAASVVSSVPVLVFFLLIRRQFFAGFSLRSGQ